jgi:hypothetical protein
MDNVDWNLKCIVFKACLVAVWTDATMSSDERRYLSHLTEMLSDSDEQRDILRKLTLHDQNEDQVLSEAAQLGEQEKAYVFETCLGILASDKRLGPQELTFVAALRKTCGISFWSYNRRLRAQTSAGARVSLNKQALVFGYAVIIAAAGLFAAYHLLREVDITPTEQGTGKEILVATLEPGSGEQLILQTGQEVFERVRKSIVTVNVFISNDPVCCGSGSVIGNDDSGTVYVLTNRHVVHNPRTEKGKPRDRVRIEVQQHSGARFDAKLDFYSRKQDIALLAVKGMGQYTEPLKLTLKQNLVVGQPVYAVGTPIGLAHTFTAGVVSAPRESHLQTDATTYSGSSGGPLVDQRGALTSYTAQPSGEGLMRKRYEPRLCGKTRSEQ